MELMMNNRLSIDIENFRQQMQIQATDLHGLLLDGDMLGFEDQLQQKVTELYNQLAQTLINNAATSSEVVGTAKTIAKKKG